MKYDSLIKNELNKSIKITKYFIEDENSLNLIESAANLMVCTFKSGNKILSCGNGGSHCDAMHFAGELVGRYRKNRLGLPSNSYF